MFSWFPLFFPLRSPLYLPSGAEVEVHVWRLSDGRGRKVWYEWAAEAYLPTAPPAPASASDAHPAPIGAGALSPALPGGVGTPNGSLNGRPPLSPMMDANFSPMRSTFFGASAGAGDAQSQGRIKIGQTGLHNAAGVHSWVGL